MIVLTIDEIVDSLIKYEEMDKMLEQRILYSIINMNSESMNSLYNKLKVSVITTKDLKSHIKINRFLTVIRLIEVLTLSQTPKKYDSTTSCVTSNDIANSDTICFGRNYSDLALKSKKSKLLSIFDKMKIKGRKNIKLANKAIDIIESL